MGNTKIVQIQEIEAPEIIGRLEGITKEIRELRSELSNRKEPTDYVTRHEVAEIFKVSLPTISEWIQKGILKSYKIANRVFMKRGEVEAALTHVKPRTR